MKIFPGLPEKLNSHFNKLDVLKNILLPENLF